MPRNRTAPEATYKLRTSDHRVEMTWCVLYTDDAGREVDWFETADEAAEHAEGKLREAKRGEYTCEVFVMHSKRQNGAKS